MALFEEFFHVKKRGLYPLFDMRKFLVRARTDFGESPADFLQRAEDFSLEETKFLKRKSVDSFNAKNPRQPGEFFIAIKFVINIVTFMVK